jgi:F-box and leucine-rich repeat protein GRR1
MVVEHSLQTLTLFHLPLQDHYVDKTIVSLLRQGAPICSVDLHRCPKLTDRTVASLVSYGQLTAPNLSGCSLITDESLSLMGKHFPQLQVLDIGLCKLVTDVGVLAVSAGCQALLRIDLQSCVEVTDVGITSLTQCRLLTDVRFEGLTETTDESIIALSDACRLLSSIDLCHCFEITTPACLRSRRIAQPFPPSI